MVLSGLNENRWQHIKIDTNRKNDFSAFRKNKKQYINNELVIKRNNKVNVYPLKAGVIIFNHDKTKVLSVQNNYVRKNGKWGLPKGHLEQYETISKAAQRELYEETSLKLDISMNDPKIKINNTTYFIYYMNESVIKTLNVIDTNEIKDIQFLEINSIPSMNTNKEMLTAVTKKLLNISRRAVSIRYITTP